MYVLLLADLAMAFAAHIFTSGSVGIIASLMGGSLLSAESCLPFAEIKNEMLHQCLIPFSLSSADSLCNQFGPRSGSTQCRA